MAGPNTKQESTQETSGQWYFERKQANTWPAPESLAPLPLSPSTAPDPEPPARKKKRKRLADTVSVIFISIFALILLAAFILTISSRSSEDRTPHLGPYSALIVLSGSMEPVFSPGDIVVVRDVAPNALVAGDIVTFRSSSKRNALVTHRIIEARNGPQGLSFVTKGDANEDPDTDLLQTSGVVGKYVFPVPYAGTIVQKARSKTGILLLIIVPALLIMAGEVRKLLKSRKPRSASGSEGGPE